MKLEETTVNSNQIYKGRILSVYCDDILNAGGKPSKREYVSHNGGSSILAIDKEGYTYLVEQYRYAYRDLVVEIPAGKLELNEDPKDCAIRELSEEIGGTCENVELLSMIYPTPGYCNEKIYIYLAEGVEIGEGHLDPGEYLSVKRVKIEDAINMAMDGTIKDSKTIIALLKYAQLRK